MTNATVQFPQNGAGQFSPEFEAFGYGRSGEDYGLDYESARDATPRWYGVSWGDGNDGVSHMWPDYYVRCCDPFLLCAAAVVANWSDKESREYAVAECEIDGEAEYTITGMILNPPDDELWKYVCQSCGYESTTEYDECPECEGVIEVVDNGSWSDSNGAWRLCEVFPVDDETAEKLRQQSELPHGLFDMCAHESLESCFTAADLKDAAAI